MVEYNLNHYVSRSNLSFLIINGGKEQDWLPQAWICMRKKISCFYEAEDEDMGTVGANKCKRMREKMLSFEGINSLSENMVLIIANIGAVAIRNNKQNQISQAA